MILLLLIKSVRVQGSYVTTLRSLLTSEVRTWPAYSFRNNYNMMHGALGHNTVLSCIMKYENVMGTDMCNT